MCPWPGAECWPCPEHVLLVQMQGCAAAVSWQCPGSVLAVLRSWWGAHSCLCVGEACPLRIPIPTGPGCSVPCQVWNQLPARTGGILSDGRVVLVTAWDSESIPALVTYFPTARDAGGPQVATAVRAACGRRCTRAERGPAHARMRTGGREGSLCSPAWEGRETAYGLIPLGLASAQCQGQLLGPGCSRTRPPCGHLLMGWQGAASLQMWVT